MAGDGAFDLVAGYAATIPGLVAEGISSTGTSLAISTDEAVVV